MDRAIQRYIIAALVLLFSTAAFAQGDIVVTKDSTGKKVVQMTLEKFAYYYQVDQNLNAIEDSMPSLAKSIELERERATAAEVNLTQQVELAKKMAEIEAQSKEDCISTATTLEIDNLYLAGALEKEKKKKWPNRIKGGATVIIVTWLGKTIIKALIP
jgi:hypothetical protein